MAVHSILPSATILSVDNCTPSIHGWQMAGSLTAQARKVARANSTGGPEPGPTQTRLTPAAPRPVAGFTTHHPEWRDSKTSRTRGRWMTYVIGVGTPIELSTLLNIVLSVRVTAVSTDVPLSPDLLAT